jgi:putative NADPH-quinone reductase
MKKILCLYAHPSPNASIANRAVVEAIRGMPNLELKDLYALYPEFSIDVKSEKKALAAADIILFQHPLFWYGMPPLLKLWIDMVLELGFAYGPGGTALRGKIFQLSITIGGAEDAYRPGGSNHFPIEAFFPAYEQTAKLCGMKWQKPLRLFHAHNRSRDELEAHGESVRIHLNSLANPKFHMEEKE